MNISVLGSQICKFRKEKGLTQEELGKAAGVSTQAVSRWECGGAPDVSLLPAIADALSVDIDALFGREGGDHSTGESQYRSHLASLPRRQQLDALVRFLFSVGLTHECEDVSNIMAGFPAHAKPASLNGQLLDVLFLSDDGFLYGICAEDLSFMSAFPEPKEGYAHYFADNDFYRKLFSALSKPNALEILIDIAGESYKLIMPAEEAKRLNISEVAAKEAIDVLADVNVLDKMPIEQGRGTEYAYSFRIDRPIVPMLMFAALVGQSIPSHFTMINNRNAAIFKKTAEGADPK